MDMRQLVGWHKNRLCDAFNNQASPDASITRRAQLIECDDSAYDLSSPMKPITPNRERGDFSIFPKKIVQFAFLIWIVATCLVSMPRRKHKNAS